MVCEVNKMQDFDHPHVMSLIGVCLDAGPGVAIVMPYMANGSLISYLKKERSSLELDEDCEIDQVCGRGLYVCIYMHAARYFRCCKFLYMKFTIL